VVILLYHNNYSSYQWKRNLFIYLFIYSINGMTKKKSYVGACYYSHMWMCHVFCLEYLFLNCVGDQLKDIG